MDIAAMSVVLNQSKVQQQVGISVMKMAMGVEATQGDSITSLAGESTKAMESSIQPNLGSTFDVRV
ncbi:YjfB family protein [Desulfosporosinus sp. BG]|uniref:YjfB family protein n=1 Tax=Desulfosporosinus sp. BG TaxID=1633135 RepID=UPI00083BA40B|nr:YjfB family protein [Desulfosporosinus sp. BG]ODA42529.1 hypothetical protein DSBG_0669 [Desulfosporosinus sp. BG]